MSKHMARLKKLEQLVRDRRAENANAVARPYVPWELVNVARTAPLTEAEQRLWDRAMRQAEARYAEAANEHPAWAAYLEQCVRLGVEPRTPSILDDFDPIEETLRLLAIPSEPAPALGHALAHGASLGD